VGVEGIGVEGVASNEVGVSGDSCAGDSWRGGDLSSCGLSARSLSVSKWYGDAMRSGVWRKLTLGFGRGGLPVHAGAGAATELRGVGGTSL
jgi:hypothetical protein